MPAGRGHNGGFNPYRDANGRFSGGGGGKSSSGGKAGRPQAGTQSGMGKPLVRNAGVNAKARAEGQAHWKTKAAYFGKTTYASRDEHNGKTYAQIQKTNPEVIKALAAKPGMPGRQARQFLEAQQNAKNGTAREVTKTEWKRRYAKGAGAKGTDAKGTGVNAKYGSGKGK